MIRPNPGPPVFLSHSIGGHFKGREPAVSIQELQHAWVSQSVVIYIGKAAALRNRPRGYMRFGDEKPAPHWGGRYIWQLADAKSLLVRWKATPDEGPRLVERRLISRSFASNPGWT